MIIYEQPSFLSSLVLAPVDVTRAALKRFNQRPSRRDTAQTSYPVPSRMPALPTPSPLPPPATRQSVAERERLVRSFVVAYRAKHGREPEPREVRTATGLPRATAWRYQQRVA